VATETPKKSDPEHKVTEAEAQIKSAPILKDLQKKIGRHPEIGAAIYEAGHGAG
jgi:glutamate formiminotransferase